MTDHPLTYNPFDFANPVSDPALFAGRDKELTDVKYYLEQAKRAPHAISLALVGGRASGKTSLLNMIDIEAQNRGFCVVRIDLDESDADSQLAFFHNLFDALLTTAVAQGAFGGIHERTYETYRDMVDAFELPEDRLFCPFLFPLQYSKAMAVGNATAAVSDTSFKRDIARIQQEVAMPIAILIDEGDVLSRSRAHLEKLRNVFMNTHGFMLAITGTESLFTALDDVFSPIARQFKRIMVTPFRKDTETNDCVTKALQSVCVGELEALDIQAIHDLSGGRPYEVQLICHFLFKSVQLERSRAMHLTVDVLDDMLGELLSPDGAGARPVILAIRMLEREQLRALSVLCSSGGDASIDQVWFMEYLMFGESRWTKERLLSHLAELVRLGVLVVTDGRLFYAGDDLDRIYCKYYAQKHRIRLISDRLPPEMPTIMRMADRVSEIDDRLKVGPHVQFEPSETELPAIVQQLKAEGLDGPDETPFDTSPQLAEFAYMANIRSMQWPQYQVLVLRVVSPWYRFQLSFPAKPTSEIWDTCPSELAALLEQWTSRAKDLGVSVAWDLHTLQTVPLASLKQKVLGSNGAFRKRIADFHVQQMYNAYTDLHDIPATDLHASLAIEYGCSRDGVTLNNLGYAEIALGKLDCAHSLLEEAATLVTATSTPGLPRYNLAVCAAMQGAWPGALGYLTLAREEAKGLPIAERIASCLFVPEMVDGQVQFPERWDIDLLEAIATALDVVDSKLMPDAQ
jgi:hypothetical protein